MKTLKIPDVTRYNDSTPIAKFGLLRLSPIGLKYANALRPIAILLFPLTFSYNALLPIATLYVP